MGDKEVKKALQDVIVDIGKKKIIKENKMLGTLTEAADVLEWLGKKIENRKIENKSEIIDYIGEQLKITGQLNKAENILDEKKLIALYMLATKYKKESLAFIRISPKVIAFKVKYEKEHKNNYVHKQYMIALKEYFKSDKDFQLINNI